MKGLQPNSSEKCMINSNLYQDAKAAPYNLSLRMRDELGGVGQWLSVDL